MVGVDERRIKRRKVRIGPEVIVLKRAPSCVNKEATKYDEERKVFNPPRVAALRSSKASQSPCSCGICHPICAPPNRLEYSRTLLLETGFSATARRARRKKPFSRGARWPEKMPAHTRKCIPRLPAWSTAPTRHRARSQPGLRGSQAHPSCARRAHAAQHDAVLIKLRGLPRLRPSRGTPHARDTDTRCL